MTNLSDLPVLVGCFSDRRFPGPGLLWVSSSRPQDHLRRRRPSDDIQDDGVRSLLKGQKKRAYDGQVHQRHDAQDPGAELPLHRELPRVPSTLLVPIAPSTPHPDACLTSGCAREPDRRLCDIVDIPNQLFRRYTSCMPAVSFVRALTSAGAEQAFRAVVWVKIRARSAMFSRFTCSARQRLMLRRRGLLS